MLTQMAFVRSSTLARAMRLPLNAIGPATRLLNACGLSSRTSDTHCAEAEPAVITIRTAAAAQTRIERIAHPSPRNLEITTDLPRVYVVWNESVGGGISDG